MSLASEPLKLAEEPLEPLLLLLEALESDVDVRVETPGGRALLRVRAGQLKNAEHKGMSGLSAAHGVLSSSVGTYELEYGPADDEGGGSPGVSLSQLLAEDSRYSEHGVEPAVRSPLERTSRPLPSGLPASELRFLSEVDGFTPLLELAGKLQAPPHEALRVARTLLKRKLIRTTTARTLHLGTPVPEPHHSSEPGSMRGADPRAASAILRPMKRSVPAQWARGARQLSGRYSSAPPAALAEEQVAVPHYLGLSQSAAAPPAQSGDQDVTTESPRHEAKTLPSTPPPAVLDELDDPLHDEDFEAPFPLVTAGEDWDYRQPMHTIEDDVVREAARGQLRDSEMPVPSSHLGQETLAQLGQLDQAIASSRFPVIPRSEPYHDDVGSPGSVPGSQALPGDTRFNPDTGLPTVGRYEVLARLKSGGMGSVYMCRLSGTAGFRRLFAMKVLHGHLADEQQTLDSFFHEARVLAGLHHPNVVGIVDLGTPQEPYIVLDYVEGGSLLELFRAGAPDEEVAPLIAVILDALAGLQAAHSATDENGAPLGLVHCDVTPHNLLVGVDGTCRVTDFGIARTGKEPVQSEVTRGKPGYIAPERIRRQPSDHRSDIFSIGVVLYAGLTGEEPFYAETAEETMHNVLKKQLPPPSEVGRRPPPCLDWVCTKALARNPEERFQSAEEMAQQLRRIADREGLLATPSEVASWVKRNLAPTLAARRAASQRGTIPPSERGPRSVSSPARHSSRPMKSQRMAHLEAAPGIEPSRTDNTGPLSDAPSGSADPDRTEILDSVLPKRSRLKKSLLYLMLLAVMSALVYVVLFPDSLGTLLREGGTSPSAPPLAADDPQVHGDDDSAEQPGLDALLKRKDLSPEGSEAASPEEMSDGLPDPEGLDNDPTSQDDGP